MAPLPNIRHERFAREYRKCGVAAQAYLKAGYQASTRNSLDASASKLLRHPKVKSRITELRKQMAARNRITVDSLVDELDEAKAVALASAQPGAAVSAIQLKAKLTGLLIDRKESGAPGDFSSLTSVEDVLAKVREELGDQAAALLSASLSEGEGKPEPVAERPVEPTNDAPGSIN